jgi:hypothetical protein
MSAGKAERYDRDGRVVEIVAVDASKINNHVHIHIIGVKRTIRLEMTLAEWRTATWAVEGRQYGNGEST